jgi:SHS2 domain-containing protein
MAQGKAEPQKFLFKFRITAEVGYTFTADTLEEALEQAIPMTNGDFLDMQRVEQLNETPARIIGFERTI